MRARSIFGLISLAVVAVGAADAQKAVEPILPGADGTVCEFIALNIGSPTAALKQLGQNTQEHAFADMLVKRAAADVDGDGDTELLDFEIYPAGESPITYGLPDNYEWRDAPPAGLDPGDNLRWWEAGRYLYFRDTWHLIYFKDRGANFASHVIAYGKTQATFACKFTARHKETVLLSSTPAVDAAYEARIERSSFGEGTGAQLSQMDKAYLSALPGGFKEVGDSLSGDGINWSARVMVNSAVQAVDMDGDGIKERFARMTLSSGATPPCAATYFELLPAERPLQPNPEKRDLWRALQSVSYAVGTKYAATCGLEHDILEVDGVGYLYTAKWDHTVIDRQLARLDARSETLSPAKISQFEVEHKIDYDAGR